MGVLLLTLSYLALALLLTAGTAWVLRRDGRRSPSLWALLVLNLLPLLFTAVGFLPGRTLAPNGLLAGVSPWCHPDLIRQFAGSSSSGVLEVNPLLADPLAQMQPWRHAARGGLLFDPATHGGAALLGNAQSAVLFPLEILARWLPPPRAATFVQAARLLLAVWGMFLLLRGLALSEGAALAGVAVWVGCGFLHFWRLHPHSYVAALAPWILLAMLRLARRPGPRPAVALAVLGALGVFAGHPETLLHTVVLGALLVLSLGGGPRRLGRAVGWIGVAAVLSLLLAAPVLLPVLENLPRSYEWQQRMAPGEGAAPVELEAPWAEVFERLVPTVDLFAWGDPRRGTWRGPENLAELGGGAVALAALALLPVALGRGRHRRLAWTWLLLGLLGLAVAAHTPLVSRPVEWIPLLRDSLVKRWSLWWALAVSVLTAVAWQRSARRTGGRAAFLGVSIGAVALAALQAVIHHHAEGSGVAAPAPWLALLPAVVLVLVVVAVPGLRAVNPWTRRVAAAGLFALLLLPQVALLGPWVPRVGAISFYPSTPAVAFVQERLREGSGEARPGYRVAGLNAALTPHAATYFDLEDVRGYDPMAFAPYVEFLRPLATPTRDSWSQFSAWDHPVLDFLGVRYLFDHPGNYAFHHPGVRQAYAGEDALVFGNPDALPRVFSPQGVAVTAAPVFALEDPQQLTAGGVGLPPPGRYRNAALRLHGLNVGRGTITVEVENLAPSAAVSSAALSTEDSAAVAVVATSQPAIPGWRLWVDGQATPPIRIQGAFLGVALDPTATGRHRIVLRYQPRTWRLGWLCALLGVILAGVSLRRVGQGTMSA